MPETTVLDNGRPVRLPPPNGTAPCPATYTLPGGTIRCQKIQRPPRMLHERHEWTRRLSRRDGTLTVAWTEQLSREQAHALVDERHG